MERSRASNLIKETFQNPFERERFYRFVKELFNHIEEASFVYRGNIIPDAYDPYIQTLERIGKYQDPEGNKIDILIVKLNKESSLEHARTMQRNFIAWYLNGSRGGELKDAALVAFIPPSAEDWRFSLVKMEYKITETPKGKIKAKEEFTPARRYSFLVGQDENSHTAQSRLAPILESETEPTLKDLEEAFGIEKVTKEFFEKYRELYLRVEETLDEIIEKDEKVRTDFVSKCVNTSDFAKKLLGQIVFLYFLQKKGWFGVKQGEDWGGGSRRFLRELFEKKHGGYNNFFNDILEPLFYEALRNDRSHDDHYFSMFKCKIPFLNGGLFDPIGNYDWRETDILLPNDLFSNTYKTKEGDIGNGILDIFDRYNFTVKEDEPLEKEVAVDPEMLGEVFENLLKVKDRKTKGTYYTPREIVHYMCRESLVNYLYSELNPGSASHAEIEQKKLFGGSDPKQLKLLGSRKALIPREDIETLIKYGETVVEHENRVVNAGRETFTYSFKLPESIRKNAESIDERLVSIRVCDPAVGSGAFLVGMMSEIIRTRNALTPYLTTRHSERSEESRTIYDSKRHAIQNCLYGVDIDPGAVEIAKLRLWLSLVVDEEDIKIIKPLPNLDYKIVQGNSLLGVEKNLFNEKLFTELERLKPLYFNETNARKKQEYRGKIDELINQITNGLRDFDFEVYFSEVFHEKKGFDVVIANPPYITYKGKQRVGIDKKEVELYQKLFINSAEYKINSFALFLEKGTTLLATNGIVAYIIPSTFLQNEYLRKIRKFLLSKYHIQRIIHFGNKVFEAVTDSIILFIKNEFGEQIKMEVIRKEDLNFQIADDKAEYLQSKWNKTNDGVINLKTNAIDDIVISKIETNSAVLDNYLSVYVGIVAHGIKKFLSNKKINAQYKKYLQGKHISKYRISPTELYVKFDIDNLHSNTDERVYLQPEKILIRKTGNVLIAAYDNSQFYTDQSIYNLYPKRENKLNLKYILALLNTSLMNFYFRKKMITNPDIFPYIKGIHLNQLPLKNIGYDQQKSFIELADKILDTTKDNDYLTNQTKQAKVREYEKQIDQLVYKLYNLTPEEIEIVEGRR